jgi:hypothetical protein
VQVVARGIPRDAQGFSVLAQGVNPEGDVAVVYSYREPTPGDSWPQDYSLGYKVLERAGWGEWEVNCFSLHTAPTLVQVEFPILYDVFQGGHTAVYGPVESPLVNAVAAIFSSGEEVSHAVQGAGFLIFSEEEGDVCELRYFDSQGQLLESKALSRRRESSDECLAP